MLNDKTNKESIIDEYIRIQTKTYYYTLVWKDHNGIANFKSFISFEDLKIYVKEYIKNGLIKNLKSLDKDKTIYYLERDE